MKKGWKIGLGILAGFFLLILIAIILIYAGTMNGVIRKQVLTQANKLLNATTTIGEFKGNPLGGLTIRDLTVEQDDRTVISIGEVEFSYNLLRLLNNEIVIKSVIINDLKMDLVQQPDSVWNILTLYKPADTITAEEPKSKFNMEIIIKGVELNKFSATIHPLDTASMIPKKIESDLSLKFRMKEDVMEANMNRMTLRAYLPDFEIRSLTFDFKSDSAKYQWDRFKMRLPHTSLVSDGKFYPRQSSLTSAFLNIDTLAFEDIRKFYPSFNLYGNPSVNLTAKGGTEKVDFTVLIKEKLQNGRISGWVKGLDTIPDYDINLNVSNIDGSSWTGDPQFTTRITGEILARGRGYDPENSTFVASGNFTEMTWQDKILKDVIFGAEKDSLNIKGNLATQAWFGGVKTDFMILDYLKRFRYSLTGSTRNINLAKLYLPKDLYSAINLKFKAQGEGMNPMKGSVRASINSMGSTIRSRPIDEFHTSFSYNNGTYNLTDFVLNSPYFLVSADGRGNPKRDNHIRLDFETRDLDELLDVTGFGQYTMDGAVQAELSGSTERYTISTQMDIASIGTDSMLINELNGDLAISKDTAFNTTASLTAGEIWLDSLVLQNLNTGLDVRLGKELSSEMTISTDSVLLNNQLLGAVKGEALLRTDDSIRFDARFVLDSLIYNPIKTGASHLDLTSSLPKGDRKSGFTAVLHQLTDQFNPAPLKKYLATIKRDSVSMDGHFELVNFAYDTLTVDKVNAELHAVAQSNNYYGTVFIKADSLNYSPYRIKESTLSTNFSNKIFENQLTFTLSDTVSGELGVDVNMQKNIEIGLWHLLFESNAETWRGGSDSTTIKYADKTIDIRNLLITASNDKFLRAEGVFSLKGPENLDVEVSNLDMKNINNLLGGTFPVAGKLDAQLKMTGTSASPIINGELTIDKLIAKERTIDQFKTSLVYQGDSISLNAGIMIEDTLRFEGTGAGRYHLSFEDSLKMPSESDPMRVKLLMNRLDMSLIAPFVPSEDVDIRGIADAELILEGPLNNININGFLEWKDGKFHMPEYGMLYDKIRLITGIENDSLFFTEFVARAGAGSLNVTGYSVFNQHDIYSPAALALKINGKEFKVVDSDRMQATINTDMTLKKVDENPVFDGRLEVIRSEANADAFIYEFTKATDESEPPMLIVALEGEPDTISSTVKGDTTMVDINPEVKFYRDLRGKLNITVPGNMWIRGKDMGFELKGDLEALKEGPKMILFGDFEVKRGFYKLYGKRFDFKSGKLTLTGDEEINPLLDFVVVYSFRDIERKLRNLELAITGRLTNPTISFQLDGSKIEEQDALSYLVFGSSMEQLTDGQRSSINSSTSGMAKNLALGQMSGMLRDALQSSLNLDVVEIAGEDNWNTGSVTIGKYISKNLFVSYQFTFALDKKTKIIEPQKISIEYQLFKFLSITATNQSPNSGFDFIFRKEYK